MPDPLRVGSVAWHRAQGTNKAAGGPGKSGSGGGGGGGNKPKPSGGGGGGGNKPKPSGGGGGSAPKPSGGGGGGSAPRPSGGGGGGGGGNAGPRPGSVAYNRLHGLNKAAGGPGKAGASSGGNNFQPAHQQAKNKAQLFNAGANNATGGGGTPWERFSADFSQADHDAFAQQLWDNTAETSGLKKGPQFQGAKWTEKGFQMDANAPMVLPKGVQEYGFKPGDQFFDAEGYTSHKENAHMDPSMGGHITGKIAYFKKDGTPMFEVAHDQNPNWDKYKDGQPRMSSEGLYQDKYNVGYGGPDDEGDMYASQAALGSIASYFKGYNNGEQTFSQAYHNFVEGDRTGGYAGDVLKMIDQGRMKVTDDQYNRIVVDAQNYDWQKRGEIAGRDAGQDFYDARAGGQAANANIPAAGWGQTRGGGGGFGSQADDFQAATQTQQQDQFNQQNMQNFDYMQFMPGARGSRFQEYTFDPMKFMQGQ